MTYFWGMTHLHWRCLWYGLFYLLYIYGLLYLELALLVLHVQ